MSKFTSFISSPTDRERVVFEIFYDDLQVAEISHEPDQAPMIEVYPAPKDTWRFNFFEFKELLEKGIRELKK